MTIILSCVQDVEMVYMCPLRLSAQCCSAGARMEPVKKASVFHSVDIALVEYTQAKHNALREYAPPFVHTHTHTQTCSHTHTHSSAAPTLSTVYIGEAADLDCAELESMAKPVRIFISVHRLKMPETKRALFKRHFPPLLFIRLFINI